MSVLFNLFFTWLCWRVGSDALDQGHTAMGWLGIGISAANFATAMSTIF